MTLFGQILREDGAIHSTEATVLAAPDRKPITQSDVLASRRGVPSIVFTKSDSQGQFTLDGLDPRATYTLVCGAKGWVSNAPLCGVSATAAGASVRLTVWKVFGCINNLLDQYGNIVPPSSFGRVTCSKRMQGSVLGAKSYEFLLAGLDGFKALESPTILKSAFFVKAPELGCEWGPVTYAYDILGYERSIAIVTLSDVTIGRIPVREVVMNRTATGFGSVRVSLKGVSIRASRPTFATVTPIELRFLPADNMNEQVTFPISSVRDDDIVIDGVPAGTYHLSLNLTANGLDNLTVKTIAAWTSVIKDTECLDIAADVGGLGSLELIPASHENEPIYVTLLRDGHDYCSLTFGTAPYRIDALLPGEYGIEAVVSGHPELVARVEKANVQPGGWSKCSLQWTGR
jgi:hypothetical protein